MAKKTGIEHSKKNPIELEKKICCCIFDQKALPSSQIDLYCLSVEISDNNFTVESYMCRPSLLLFG
jgi:hypothetical protein